MTDLQLHHARWVPIESVVAFWDIFITPPPPFIVQGKEGIFFLIATTIINVFHPYQKQIKAAQRLHKHYTSCARSSATFKLFNTPVHSDHKVKNL